MPQGLVPMFLIGHQEGAGIDLTSYRLYRQMRDRLDTDDRLIFDELINQAKRCLRPEEILAMIEVALGHRKLAIDVFAGLVYQTVGPRIGVRSGTHLSAGYAYAAF